MQLSDVTPNLVVSDTDRSLRFYRDVLGFTVTATVPESAPHVFVWLQRGGVSVFINASESVTNDMPALAGRPIGGTNTMFVTIEAETVENGIDAFFAEVSSGGARVVMPLKNQFYGMREFGIEDPDGYIIFFAQRIG